MYRYLLTLFLGLLPACFFAQNVMMQAWYWDYPKPNCNLYLGDSWATTLNGKVTELKNAGFTHLWLPPLSRASFGDCSNGYDPKDLYDYGQYTGQTGFGTGTEVSVLINSLNANNMKAVADVVYNHRDGGAPETNPAVKAYIETHFNNLSDNGKFQNPFPSDRFRYVIPLGGALGAGDYYIKVSSKTNSSRFYGKPYRFYAQTSAVGWQNKPDSTETEASGSGVCGRSSTTVTLGRNFSATISSGDWGACDRDVDEFHIHLTSAQYNNAGDVLEIYISNVNGNYSDHRIFDIYYDPEGAAPGWDVGIGNLTIQTYTDFSYGHGLGTMNYEDFRPNSGNTATTWLEGDRDWLWFFYDYDQMRPATRDKLNAWTKWLWTDLGIKGFRMDAVKHFDPAFVSQLMNYLYAQSPRIEPDLVVGEFFDSDVSKLNTWVSQASMGVPSSINVRAFDFSLRQALKEACDNGVYDVRNIYNAGLVAAGASGFNSVTFINNHDYRTVGEHILNRQMLAYAYILTNNKIGLPCVFYPDYYGVDIYGPGNPLTAQKTAIDQLIQVHNNYIAGATFVDYLNREGTPYSSAYLQSGPYDLLLYQIQYGPVPNKDVIVAINFENQPLRVNHTINTARAPLGTQFNLAAGAANYTTPVVENSPNGIPNSIYLDIPAYSYAVFVQGALLPVTLTTFEATPKNKSVQLSWAAETEDQFSGYEVQRSLDGQTYQKIAWVDAKGTSGGPANYELYDDQPVFNKPMYYRLRMVDLDGSAEFSPIRSVTLQQKEEVVLFPNPSKGQFFLRFEEAVQPGTLLEIMDALGRRITQKTLEEGTLLEEISLDGAANGVYRVRVVRAGQVVYQGVMHHIR